MPPRESLDRTLRMRAAAWLRVRMKDLEWDQATVARECDVDPGFLSRILNDPENAALGLDNWARLSWGLRVNPNAMLNQDPKPGIKP